MKTKIQTLNALQVETGRWLAEVLGEERAKDVRERNFRFGEEALELMQDAGMRFSDLVKLAIYVYNKPAYGRNPAEEAGDALHGLIGLISALGEDLEVVVAKSCEKLIARTEATKAKAAKWTGGPLPGDVDKQYANDSVMTVLGDLTEQLRRANSDAVAFQERCLYLGKEIDTKNKAHQSEIEGIETRYKVHMGDLKNLQMRLDNALQLNLAQKIRIENLENMLGAHQDAISAAMADMDRDIPVVSTEHGQIGVITGDPARLDAYETQADRNAAYAQAQVLPDDQAAHAVLEADGLRRQVEQLQGTVRRLRDDLVEKATRAQVLNERLLKLENELDRMRTQRDKAISDKDKARKFAKQASDFFDKVFKPD